MRHTLTNAVSRIRMAATHVILLAAVAAGCAGPLAPEDAGFPLVTDAQVADLPPQLRLAYEEDAVRLAIRELVRSGSPARHDVEPPASLVNSLLAALAHVYATQHPARDEVVERYRIHTFPDPATREIMVRVDPAHGWTQAWRARTALTGNAAVDALVTRYSLSVPEFYSWPGTGEVAVLRAAAPLNATALAARFEGIPGVIWAERNGHVGDGNDIRATRQGDGWRLDYSVGFGDCPSGCIDRHTWSFVVSGSGAVQYLGASGPTPPAGLPG